MADKQYIERGAVLAKIDAVFFKTDPSSEEQLGFLKSRGIIREHPAADVVEVCRCKDCTHMIVTGWCSLHDTPMEKHDFCSYGERKEADNG